MTDYTEQTERSIKPALIPGSWAGALVGLFLGYMLFDFGFWATFVVAILGLVGYGIGAFLRGELDLVAGLSRFQQGRRLY